MIKPIKKEYMKVLERIQNSIPKELLDNVTKKVDLAPKSVKLIKDIANGTPNDDIDASKLTQELVEKCKAIVDSGQLKNIDKMVDIEDKEITSKIDKFIEEEIEKAIKRGELPKGKKFRNLKKVIKCKKIKA